MEYDEIKITDQTISTNPCCVYSPPEKQFKWYEDEQTKDISFEQRRKKEKLFLTWIKNGGNKF
jgi:hypothetical protein